MRKKLALIFSGDGVNFPGEFARSSSFAMLKSPFVFVVVGMSFKTGGAESAESILDVAGALISVHEKVVV